MGSRNILQKLNSEDPRVVSSISENQLWFQVLEKKWDVAWNTMTEEKQSTLSGSENVV
jgi:hypothetical protein